MDQNDPSIVKYRSYCKSVGAAFSIGMTGVSIGYGMSQMSPITTNIYVAYWRLTFSAVWCQIMMIGIAAVSAIFGASFSKITIAKLSRKMNLVLASIIIILASFIMLIPYQEALIIGRILQGFGMGI